MSVSLRALVAPNVGGQIKGRAIWPFPKVEIENFNVNDEVEISFQNRDGTTLGPEFGLGLEGLTKIRLSNPSVKRSDHLGIAEVEFTDLKPSVVSKMKQQFQLVYSLHRQGRIIAVCTGSDWLLIPSRANKGSTYYVSKQVLEEREAYFHSRRHEEPAPHHAVLSYTSGGSRYEITLTNNYVFRRKDLLGPELDQDRATINPEHARLFWDRGDWWIEDMGTKNGTYIVVDTGCWKVLHTGNVINLGNSQLLVTIPEGTKEEVRVPTQAASQLPTTTVIGGPVQVILPVLILTVIEQAEGFREVKGASFPFRSIPPEGISIGRYPTNHIPLEDQSISRENHATIILDDQGTFFIRNNNERQPMLIRLSQKDHTTPPRKLSQNEIIKFSFSSRLFFQFHRLDDPPLDLNDNPASPMLSLHNEDQMSLDQLSPVPDELASLTIWQGQWPTAAWDLPEPDPLSSLTIQALEAKKRRPDED